MRFTAATVAFSAFFSTVYGLAAPAPQTTTTSAPAAVPSPSTVVSGGSNAIIAPLGDVPLEAGKAITIKWTPNYGDKVTLVLRKGDDSNNLDTITEIASDIPNSGELSWTPPKDLKGDDDYAIQIISGAATNYSPKFEVNSDGEGPKSTKASSSASPSTTKSSSASGASSTTKATKTSSVSASASASASAEPSADASSTAEESSSPSPSATGEEITAPSDAADSAAGQLSSPLALVLCIVASLAYFH